MKSCYLSLWFLSSRFSPVHLMEEPDGMKYLVSDVFHGLLVSLIEARSAQKYLLHSTYSPHIALTSINQSLYSSDSEFSEAEKRIKHYHEYLYPLWVLKTQKNLPTHIQERWEE